MIVILQSLGLGSEYFLRFFRQAKRHFLFRELNNNFVGNITKTTFSKLSQLRIL